MKITGFFTIVECQSSDYSDIIVETSVINQILWIHWISIPFRDDSIGYVIGFVTFVCLSTGWCLPHPPGRHTPWADTSPGRHFPKADTPGQTPWIWSTSRWYAFHWNAFLLLPANEVWGKVIFLHLSVILFTGGSAWTGTPLGRYTPQAGTPPSGQVYPPLGRYTPGSSACWEIRATSGRYASHWNAFLLTIILLDAEKELRVFIFWALIPVSSRSTYFQCEQSVRKYNVLSTHWQQDTYKRVLILKVCHTSVAGSDKYSYFTIFCDIINSIKHFPTINGNFWDKNSQIFSIVES